MPPPVFRWFSLRRGTSLGNVPESYPASVAGDDEKDLVDDTSSRRSALVIVHAGSIPMPSFQVKRVDCYYSSWSKLWKYRNTNYKVAAEGRSPRTTVVPFPSIIDQWKDCALVLVRTIPIEKHLKPTFKYIVNSLHIKTVCQDVIRSWPGIDWGSDPLEISPKVFIAFYRRFCIYRDALKHKPSTKRTVNESYLLASVSFLIDALGYDFGDALKELDQLLSKKETTFGHLCNLFIPGTLLVSQCRATNLPRVYLLTSVDKDGSVLECESMDVVDGFLESTDIASSGSEIRNETKVGKVKTKINLRYFDGTVKITDLAAYPIMFHPNEAKLREQLIERGKKWLDLIGVHHKQYDGPAIIRLDGIPLIQKIKSRIMVDRASFGCFHPSYSFPAPVGAVDQYKRKIVFANACLSQANVVKPILSDEELLLTPTVVHGFSLSDKLWLEFNINLVKDVEWNDEAFKNLVLPAEKKSLLQSVVDVHHRGLGVNDFVKEKGQGLVINLSGPPGTGKTFTAEGTSEYARKPLYVVGPGDLGTSPEILEHQLQSILDVATAWKAIVLIDEVDVFLEKWSHADLGKNAMVAAFLRHIEYYPGILFLTTNHLSAYGDAFLSRIHVALHFTELSEQSRFQIWTAFINRLGMVSGEGITAAQMQQLAKRDANGHQIKNVMRTAQSLATARGQKFKYTHFVEALDAMEDFMMTSPMGNYRTLEPVGLEDLGLVYCS